MRADRLSRLVVVTALVGVGAGLGGMALALLLHLVQHLAYGYVDNSFTGGVESAPWPRRVLVVTGGGLVAGFGWWALHRFGRRLVGIAAAVRAEDPRMPVLTTVCHALLQIITVALGSPLGREVAPREIGAVIAGWISSRAGLSPAQCRTLVACGAGAGLAAVYDVPLGGAVFTLEVLLGSWSVRAVLPAVVTSVLATVVSWIGLPNQSQYELPRLTVDGSLIVWSAVIGPVAGVGAYWFSRATSAARQRAPRGRALLVTAPLAFLVLGLLSIPFPQLLGNGKGPAQLAFDSTQAPALFAALLVLRALIVVLCLGSGAAGGLLTPSLANGALLGVLAGGLWALAWPGASPGSFAVVGAAAFLAAAQRMPLTAVVLIMEFTNASHDLLVPVLLAVAGAVATERLCGRRAKTG
ncbi:chloride channel protein [Kutzneria albida]|uniref:Cl-channel, voltage gated n=1 Tax=Kutzneria albida DSM 43870 TaxID=1449976 RepID=W5VZQ8_9PSEU|nr:chloride channel protein [Kutzneria albida]AHH94057.1 Cl- channel, voltage gated [Kutzneria albida DSM 43870]